MHISRERYFSIHTQNNPGELARVTSELMEQKVSCSAIWGFGSGDDAEIIVVPIDSALFKSVAKNLGWGFTESICFLLKGQDKTGALVDILDKISSDGINLKAVDAIAVEERFACYILAMEDDLEHLAQVLGLSTPKP